LSSRADSLGFVHDNEHRCSLNFGARHSPGVVISTSRSRPGSTSPGAPFGAAALQRTVKRGELSADLNLDLALDLLAAPLYWRLNVRRAATEPNYPDSLTDHLMRAINTDAVTIIGLVL